MLAKEGKPKEKNPTEETRQLVLERDHYRCVRCGRDVRYTPFGYSIHHRRLRSHPYAEMTFQSKPHNPLRVRHNRLPRVGT